MGRGASGGPAGAVRRWVCASGSSPPRGSVGDESGRWDPAPRQGRRGILGVIGKPGTIARIDFRETSGAIATIQLLAGEN